jgi:hypothetical protein
MDQVRFGIARLGRGGARVALLSPQSFPDEARDRPIRTMNDALHAVAREAEIPFLDRHQLMTWWASSRTLYPDELLGEDALHMADRSYECLAIRLERFPIRLHRYRSRRRRSSWCIPAG